MSIRPNYWRNDRSKPTAIGPNWPIDVRSTQTYFSRYKVVIHHTAGIGLMVVVRAVMELTRFGNAEAEYRMWEAHHSGRSLVLITHRERAELFVEQFADRGIAASIEPE